MTAVLGIFGSRERPERAEDADTCLHAMEIRGDRARVMTAPGALVAAAHFEWDTDLAVSNPDRIARDDHLVVAADAALYYVEALRRALHGQGVDASGTTAPALIAAAYRAWGDECVRHLEGDYAFVLFDDARKRVLCARDFTGRRSLYFANVEGTLVVASSIAGVRAHPACPPDFDLDYLASLASFLFASDRETPYRAIKALRPGVRLTWQFGEDPREEQFWHFPALQENTRDAPGGFDRAADELRGLLAGAVMERLAANGPTAICMSGGYDSPALFGAGKMRLRELRDEERLRVVSMSYPPGDPGREDELITEIAARWNAPIHWLHIDDVPMVDHLAEFARQADEPLMHAFEEFIRALAVGARGVGARVALLGDGGDPLFALSRVYLLDLFAQLRWGEFSRDWHVHGRQGYRDLVSGIVLPLVRSALRGGRPAPSDLAADPPPWIREDFLRRNRLIERERLGELALRPAGYSRGAVETQRAVRHPLQTKVHAACNVFGLAAGVEFRAPLLDERIVRFAAQRPRSDRASAGDVKLLLRRSMRGLLPEGVLSARPHKTGVLTDYFERSLRADRTGLIERTFRDPVLAQFGILDPVRLLHEWHEYRRQTARGNGHKLFITLQVELWIRSHLSASGSAHAPRAPAGGSANEES